MIIRAIILHLYCHTSPDKAGVGKFQHNTENDSLILLQAPTFGNWLGLTEWTPALRLIGQMRFFTFHFKMTAAQEIGYHSFSASNISSCSSLANSFIMEYLID